MHSICSNIWWLSFFALDSAHCKCDFERVFLSWWISFEELRVCNATRTYNGLYSPASSRLSFFNPKSRSQVRWKVPIISEHAFSGKIPYRLAFTFQECPGLQLFSNWGAGELHFQIFSVCTFVEFCWRYNAGREISFESFHLLKHHSSTSSQKSFYYWLWSMFQYFIPMSV